MVLVRTDQYWSIYAKQCSLTIGALPFTQNWSIRFFRLSILFFLYERRFIFLLWIISFLSQVYLVFRSGGKSHDDAIKSSGAKFICRSQVRSNPYASATSSSTQHGTCNGKLENQAILSELICSSLNRCCFHNICMDSIYVLE